MSAIDEVRERLDVIAVVGDYVQLKRAGRIYRGLCPFHDERTPSFVVFPDSGHWRCFGACAVGGDAFDFVMRLENVDFRGALEILARRVGVALEPPSPEAARRQDERDRLRDATAGAAAFFHAQLLRSPSAAAARDYLKGRGFGVDVAQAFGLGWAPGGFTALVEALGAEGFGHGELVAAGLARRRDDGGVFDTFRERLVFPIHDARGRVVGFGARTLDPAGQPKYINSPQSHLFDKSHVLYGLHRAAKAIRVAGEAVVVEGYTDVIRAHVAGFENVVASLGTALTEHQVKLLKRYAPVVVLALDADAAGQAATLRGLEVAREAAAGDPVPVPTAAGWTRYAQRTDVELRVARLPAGLDPDDLVRRDPDAWRAAVAAARPVMEYLFDALTQDLDLRQPSGKTRAADRLLPVVGAIADEVAKRAWLARLAEMIGIDERALASRLPAPPRDPAPPSRAGGRGSGASHSDRHGSARRDSGDARPGRGDAGRRRSEAGRGRAEVAPERADDVARLLGLAAPAGARDAAPANRTADADPPAWAVESVPADLPPAEDAPAPLADAETDRAAGAAGRTTEGSAPRAGSGAAPGRAGADRAGAPAAGRADAPAPGRADSLSAWVLGCLIASPRRLKRLDAALRRDGLAPLGPDDFPHPLERDLIEAVRCAGRGAPPPDAPPEHRLDALPAPWADYAALLRDQVELGPLPGEPVLLESLHRSAWLLRKRAIESGLPALRLDLVAIEGEDQAERRAGVADRLRSLMAEKLRLDALIVPPAPVETGKTDATMRSR